MCPKWGPRSNREKQRFLSGNRCFQHNLTKNYAQNRVLVDTSSTLPSARASLLAGFGEVHRQAAPPQLLLIECVNRLVAAARHRHKAEAAQAAGVSVSNKIYVLHLLVGIEQIANFLRTCGEWEIANIDVCRHSCLLTTHACKRTNMIAVLSPL